MITSFGYETSAPLPRSTVFDVRELTHKESSPEFVDTLRTIIEYGRAHPGENISIGCKLGQHRSVALANRAAAALRTSVHHRDRGF